MSLKNRLVFPPILTKYATEDGFVTDPLIAFYRERARGGVGLIIVESAYVDPLGKFAKKMLGICDDKFLSGLERLTRALHLFGVKVAVELSHAGRQTSSKIVHAQPVAPSELACPIAGERPRALSTEEIEVLIDQFSEGAKRARKAGFDGVEFDGGYGHLISQFLSPHTNQRTDNYGGDRISRLRFVEEIIISTQTKVSQEFPILFRLNGDDLLPGGNTVAESKEIAKALERLGVRGIDIVAGMHESRKNMEYFSRHSSAPGSPQGVWVPLARQIKETVSIPVIAGGRINDPLLAEEILQKNEADLIAIGRPLIADPEFPQKAEQGGAEGIRLCVGCGTCQKRSVKTGLSSEVRCLVNPEVGREGDSGLVRVSKPKRVVIIGGGVGGMEAARVASLRGHRVTLFEKGNRLGGQVWLSMLHPLRKEMENIVRYLGSQLQNLSVKVRLDTEVTPKLIRSLEFDGIIVATGARPIIPKIPGLDKELVSFAHEALTGSTPSGQKVVIGGGGLVGAEVADFLGSKGKEVTLVEMLDMIMQDDETFFRSLMLHRLGQYGTRILTNTAVKEVREKRVLMEQEGKLISLEADHFVIAFGYEPDQNLYRHLKDWIEPDKIYVIGDCVRPRKVIDAIFEGHQAGLKI